MQTLLIVLSITLGTIITRFFPFLIFPDSKETPPIIRYLGRVFPPTMMGLLVIYCLRNVTILESPHGIPECFSILIIILLHKWKGNVLLSVGFGTILYMLLIQNII